jgi:hypothetical protein
MLFGKPSNAWSEFQRRWYHNPQSQFKPADATDAFDDFVATIAGNDRKRASVRSHRVDKLYIFDQDHFRWAVDNGLSRVGLLRNLRVLLFNFPLLATLQMMIDETRTLDKFADVYAVFPFTARSLRYLLRVYSTKREIVDAAFGHSLRLRFTWLAVCVTQ